MLAGTASAATEIGGRETNEDRHLVLPFPRGHLLAVLDGHGGAETADHCLQAIPQAFRADHPDGVQAAVAALVESLARQTATMRSGSTLAVACISEVQEEVITAVLGDSVVIVVDAQDNVWMSELHNVGLNPAERQAAEARGGVYQGGYICNPASYAGLQLSRALGDVAMGEIVDRTPSIARHPLGQNSVVVLASDGLEVTTPADAVRLAVRAQGGLTAAQLIDLERRQRIQFWDNVTVVVWRHTRSGGDAQAQDAAAPKPGKRGPYRERAANSA